MTAITSGLYDTAVEQAAAYTAALLAALGNRDAFEVMSATPDALRAGITGLTAAQLRTPERAGKWSITQLLQHLADSELVASFRFRMILAHDHPDIPGYDQDAWATRLRYEDADPDAALGDFTMLRRANLRLLSKTTPEERARSGVHAERGEESVAHLMKMMGGHDTVHLRQLARIRAAVEGK